MSEVVYRVAVDAAITDSLSYLPPAGGAPLERGQSVQVPLGRRKVNGVVLNQETLSAEFKLKSIDGFVEERPVLPEPFLKWTEWLAQYYFFPHGLILESVFPSLSKKSRKKKPIPELAEPETPPQLTPEQAECLESLRSHSGFNVHLLFGVTGSGKTEVYLNMMADVLEKGGQALMLVPEISLTPQLIDRFSKRFPGRIAVLHSGLTPRERTDHWWAMQTKEKSILIGARSALFCPVPDLKLIIVDEEHEPSYKQEEKLKYHGRDAAVMLGRQLNIPVVLGSATPSLESWNNVRENRYILHEMKHRVAGRSLPLIEVVDLRDEREARRDLICELPYWLSRRLFEEMQVTLARSEQVALFLNRRGLAPSAQCPACAHVEECPNCSVSLTVHGRDHLVCHYCNYTLKKSRLCPKCKEAELTPLGMGTELIESDLTKLFPQARLARADRDEIQTRAELEHMIRSVETRDVDILIGTQMIAKGLDFPHLTLVGLVLADIGFHWPDFRAAERSFQLLTQVSGRSGRHSANPGRVIVQTYSPFHPSIRHTVAHDYLTFADDELDERKDSLYPPFQKLALFRVQSTHPERALETAKKLSARAHGIQRTQAKYNDVQVLGPAPAPLAKLRGQYRYHVLIKAPDSRQLHAFCAWCLGDENWVAAATKVQVDVDPLHML